MVRFNPYMNIKQNLVDLIELFLLPALAAIIPWPLCFRIFKYLAGFDCLYRSDVQGALRQAEPTLGIKDVYTWASAYRLTKLVDHADLYLSLFRSDRWLDKYVTVTGPGWPDDGAPFMAITFHWGAGMWSLRHLKRHLNRSKKPISGLMKGFERSEFFSRFIRYCYVKLRSYAISMAGVKNLIFLDPSSYFKLKRAVKSSPCLLALFDVPTIRQHNIINAQLFGHNMRLPRGLAYLAANEGIKIVAYSVSIDRENGLRRINISEPMISNKEEELSDYLVKEFKKAVYSDTPSWHCWEYVNLFV